MIIISETSLSNFNFWSGAESNAKELTKSQLDIVESVLEDIYPEGITDTNLNDLFWFEFNTVKEWLGIGEVEEIEDEDTEDDE